MRVLHFFKTYFPDSYGGIEQVINQIARGTTSLGIETHVLSLSESFDKDIIELDGHFSHRVKQDLYIASTGMSFSVFSRFKALAAEADIIHYHYPWPMMDLVHLMTNFNKPTVVTYHSDIVKQKYLLKLYQPMMMRFLKSVDKIVATSPNYLESSLVLNEFQSKVSVIPIGLDKSVCPIPSAEVIKQWRDRVGEKFFLFIGVLRYYKGLHVLVEAAQTANYPIVIAGAGPIENELKEQVKQLGLKNVYFVGRISDVDKVALLKLCHAVVFPSHLRSEAFGITLLEGAMYGKPMISCEIGTGTSFVNIDGETGKVVAPSDPVALANAMILLWEDAEFANVMGGNAFQRYLKLFTAEQMASQYAQLYRELSTK